MFIQSHPDAAIHVIISIAGKHEQRVGLTVAHRLELSFDDVEVPNPSDMISMSRAMARRHRSLETGLHESPPTKEDAEAIVRFAESSRDASGDVLIHCSAGMSRAPAAAFICLAVWKGGGNEIDAVHEVRRLRPGAVPHVGLVRFADEILMRGGHLAEALMRIDS